jgi:N-ethylmaleimide reductase
MPQHYPALFTPVTLGDIALRNRLIMAPMTRARCPDRVPTDSVVTYYTQRAGAGLLITEATQISVQGTGSIATPGIHTGEQVAGWRHVTDAVHAAGGAILCQIWHVGRVSHACFQENDQAPVSSSDVHGEINTFTASGFERTTPPRPLYIDEIPGVIADYARAARNAIRAGFDGVQIHAASGYLIDQFLRDGCNRREDAYGGSVENRCRFLLEVTDAVVDAIGAGRTSVRLSPFTVTWDCRDSNPQPLFTHAVTELDKRDLAFLEIVERGFDSVAVTNTQQVEGTFSPRDIRGAYRGRLVVNGCYQPADAANAIESGYAEAVSIARPYISTPDYAERVAAGVPLNPDADPAHWYGGGDEGYIDLPAMDDTGA